MGRNKDCKEQIIELSKGVLNTALDLSLFVVAFGIQSYSVGSGKTDFFKALENSGDFVNVIRKNYLKRASYVATKKELLRKNETIWELTEKGQTRLEEILPRYRTKRPWDGKIYLITYDIPENKRKDRDRLREYLKRIGCGMFQASVWLTPYDPREKLNQLTKDFQLTGFIAVSNIGRDGNVGQMSVGDLVQRVYRLDKLNERYGDFIIESQKRKMTPIETNLYFLSILKDDPQLPFSLLPEGWLGDKALKIYNTLITVAYKVS